ncbi:MAG: hypothetical protein AAB799_01900 [Patescibacteria group bacterium]
MFNVVLFVLSTVAAAAEKPQVAISTSSRFLVAPISKSANVRLVVRMEKHERNWELEVGCDGVDGGISTSSTKSFWNGEKQAEIYDIGFTLSPATYDCEAVLLRKQEDGKMKKFTSPVVEVTIH